VRVYVATTNAGKRRELEAILSPLGWNVEAYPGYAEAIEGDTSYEDNAAHKARKLAAQLASAGIRAAVIADDSGLEVAALAGRPGVLSARYGDGTSWPARRRALLDELAATGSSDRSARFVCAMHMVEPDGRETAARGTVDGTIAAGERGSAGFSYDALFEYPPLGKTFGELEEEEKNAVSHRSVAARTLLARWRDAARTGSGM
jgi:XTP/dITP diphosphohydrolase